MLLKSSRVLTSFCLAIFLCLLSVNVYAETSVVARVGSVPITEFELGRKLQKLVPLASSFHKGIAQEKINELQKEALASLVEKAYMVQYALSEEIAVSAKEIDAVFKPVRERFSSKKDFKKALGNESIADFRAAIYRKLLADKALDVAVAQKVKVIDGAIKAYYEENKNRYKRPRQFRASHILIKVDPAATAEAKAERLAFAKDLTTKAKAGDDFHDLAYYNSDDRTKYVGGDLGTFHQGQMLKEIEDAILKMKVGDISGTVQTLYGYSIIKLVEDSPPKQLTYDEMKNKLTEEERKKQFETLKSAWLELLKTEYKVEYSTQ